MSRAVLRAKGQITLPCDIRDALHVDEGDDISFVITDKGVLMHGLKIIPAEQAWFWCAQWQEREREASADLEAGRTTRQHLKRLLPGDAAPMTSTYERTARFHRDWDALSPPDRGRFREMVTKFVADLEAGEGFRSSIRVKHIEGTSNVYEVTFTPEGRATWEYGKPALDGAVHVIWRRVGTPAVCGRR